MLPASKYFSLSKNYILILLSFLWCLWVLFPLLDSGFIGDDAYNSQIRGTLISNNISLFNRLWGEIYGWLVGAGRFNPVGWIFTWTLYYFVDSFIVVKVIAVIIIWLSIFYFSLLIKSITNNEDTLLFVLYFLPILIQFRLWHDPVISFTSLIPLTSLFIFSSLYYFNIGIIQNNLTKLILALVLFTLAILSYEIVYFLFPIYIFIFYQYKYKYSKNLIYVFISLLLITLTHLFISKYFKNPDLNTYPLLQPNWNWGEFWRAYKYQVLAALPLSWRLAKGVSHWNIFPLIGYQTYVFLLFSIITYFYLMRCNFAKIFANKVNLFIVFILLLFVPLSAALSSHQNEISSAGAGYGYIVIYTQYFAIVLIFLFMISFIKDFIVNKYIKILCISLISLSIAFFGLVHRNENAHVIKSLDFPFKLPRKFLGSAISEGLLNNIGINDVILSSYRSPADNAWFLTQSADRKIYVCSINVEAEYLPCLKRNFIERQGIKVFGLHYVITNDFNNSFLILAELLIDNNNFEKSRNSFNHYYVFKNNILLEYYSNEKLDFDKILKLPLSSNHLEFNPDNFLIKE